MIIVEFDLNQKKRTFQYDKKTKLKKIFIKYAKKENLNINKLMFLSSGINYNSNQELNKTLEEILTKDDKNEKKILITVNKCEDGFERTITAININDYENSSEDSHQLIDNDFDLTNLSISINEYENSLEDSYKINDEDKINNYIALLKLYLVLFIKFLLITIIFGICSFFDIDNKYLINKKIKEAAFIIANLTMVIISIILFFIQKKYKKSKIMLIFSFLSILCIIIICLFLSKYINYKIILICLY